jgi:hypothetical protein
MAKGGQEIKNLALTDTTQACGRMAMRQFPLFIILVIFIVSLTGCELVGDIFKAGVWVGALLVIGLIAFIIWMFSKAGS